MDNERMREGRDLKEVCGERRFGADWIENEKSAGDFSRNDAHPLLLADFDRLIIGQRAGGLEYEPYRHMLQSVGKRKDTGALSDAGTTLSCGQRV